MKIFRYIVILAVICIANSQQLTANSQISTEQEQQFTYYWYAAKQAIVEERYDEAYVLLTFCNAIKPNDGATLTFLGIIEQGIGNEMKGLKMYRDGFEADPYDQWFHYSKVLLEMDSPVAKAEALRVLEKAHEVQQPNCDEDLLDQLQSVYINNEMWTKAIQIQDELDKIRGYNDQSAWLRTRIWVIQKKPKKALAEVNKYLELDPSDVRFWVYKVELMTTTKAKTKDIYAAYDRIIELNPGDLMTLNNYAWMLATHKGDLNKAEAMSAITIHEEPDNPTYLDTYGWIMYLKGQKDLAGFYLGKAFILCTDEKERVVIHKHLMKVEK